MERQQQQTNGTASIKSSITPTTTSTTLLTKATRRIGSVASYIRRWSRIIFYSGIGFIVLHSFVEFTQLNKSFLSQPIEVVVLSPNTNNNTTTTELNNTIESTLSDTNNITTSTATTTTNITTNSGSVIATTTNSAEAPATTTTITAENTTTSRRDYEDNYNATTTTNNNATTDTKTNYNDTSTTKSMKNTNKVKRKRIQTQRISNEPITKTYEITESYYYIPTTTVNSNQQSVADPNHPKIWPAASNEESYNRSSTTINTRSSINHKNRIPTDEISTAAVSRILQNRKFLTTIDVWKIQLDQLQFHYKFMEHQPPPLLSDEDIQNWRNQTEYMISILQKSEQRLMDGFYEQQYQYDATTSTTKSSDAKNIMDGTNNMDRIIVVREYPLYDVSVTIESLDPLLVYGIDESYTISIPYPTNVSSTTSSSNNISITAVTIYGAMHAYQSLRQLLELTPTTPSTTTTNDKMKFVYHYRIYDTPINIIDEPFFSYRGLLIDTARHYIPIDYIIHNMNIMEMNKLNVFHWHVTDHQSWPYLSLQYPELAIMGAYCPTDVQGVVTESTPNKLSRRHRQRQRRRLKAVFVNPRTNITTIKICDIYTMEDVQTVIQAGSDRGIRIIFEFDTPGHATVIGNSHPELMTECPTIHDPLDVTKDIVYEFVHKLYDEISDLYATNSVNNKYYNATRNDLQRGRRKRTTTLPTYDDWIHIGGDEVNTTCWENSVSVKQYMTNHSIANVTELVALFEKDLFETVDKLHKSPMVWQEIFETNDRIIPRNTIIDIWKVWEYSAELRRATNYGYDVIFSAGFYLDYWHILFDDFYNFNLYQHLDTTQMQSHALGGSASMWTESVPPHRLTDSIWPRTSAMAERLWTNSQHSLAGSTYPQRMERFRCLMVTQLNSTIAPFGNTNCNLVLYNEYDTD